MNSRTFRFVVALALISISHAYAAGPAPFDLTGPTIEVTVARGSTVLPIAQAPHLAVGDKLSIKADFPTTQSEHYLLIVAFLRGPDESTAEGLVFQLRGVEARLRGKRSDRRRFPTVHNRH